MTFNKVYIGQELPLSIRKGEDVLDQIFTVLDTDGSAYDFTGFTDLNMIFYDRRGGKVIATVVNAATGVDISANVITWNSVYATDLAMRDLGLYFYEMQHKDANSKIIDTFFGPLKVI